MPELLTVKEVADILKVSYETALEYIKLNNLAIKVGRQYRVSREKLSAHLNKQQLAPLKLNRSR